MFQFTVQFDEYPMFQGQLGNGAWLNGEMVIEADRYEWGIIKVKAYVGPNETVTETVTGELATKITDFFMARKSWVTLVDELHAEHFSADAIAQRAERIPSWMEGV